MILDHKEGMKIMLKAFIFDLDGVICFTDKYHYQAWKVLADEYGIYFDEVINNRLRGVSRMESLEIILERYEGDASQLPKEEMAEKKNNVYRELLKNITPADVSQEVLDTLSAIKAKGIKIAIGSSSKNTPMILERLGIADLFDAVSDGNNIVKTKPDPEVFSKAAGFLGEAAEGCIVVEDAVAGIEAGNSAGMKTIAIGDATSCGLADYNIESFKEILDIMEKEM